MEEQNSFTDNILIEKNIAIIKDFCGLEVKPCPNFRGIRTSYCSDEKYFNVIISDNYFFNSVDYCKLELCVEKGLFEKVEPNGRQRVAIFLK